MAPDRQHDETLDPPVDGTGTLSLSPDADDSTTPAGGEASPARDVPPGYEVEGELGRGGMGVVYKALHLALNRPVALKMLRSGVQASSVELLRFKAEGETVARLNHPNVVQVHEVGVHAGSPYLVLEYCAGGNLDEKLAGAPLPPRRAAELVATLARAVHSAHAAGIVHRDLKPANVLLTADGKPKVADFGLAKWVEAGDGVTVTGAVLGTPSYMAPEQASGDTKAIDRRADVYALGAILYACLTGRPPFKGATPLDTLDQVRSHEPASVRSLQPGTPRDLETVCLKCLQKSSGKRYLSAAALADDLDRYLSGNSILARPVGSRERAWRWCRRNPAVAALLASVLAVSLAGTAASLASASVANDRRAEAEEAKGRAVQGQREADAARAAAQGDKRRAEWSAYISQMSLCQREWELGNAPAAFRTLGATNPDLRGWEYTYLERLFVRDRLWASRHPLEGVTQGGFQGVVDLALSPKGDRLATADSRGVNTWDAESGALVHHLPILSLTCNCVAISPDGETLLTGDGWKAMSKGGSSGPGRVAAWDVATGKLRAAFPTLPGAVACVRFHPAGRHVVVACGDGTVYWLDAKTGETLRSAVTGHGEVLRVAVSPDGKSVASMGYAGGVEVYDDAGGGLVRTLAVPLLAQSGFEFCADLAFSPDSLRLATTRNGLHVWDVKTPRPSWSLGLTAIALTRVCWTPDGTSLYTAGQDRMISQWDAGSGQRTRRVAGHLAGVVGLALADGVAYSGGAGGAVVASNLGLPAEPRELRTKDPGWFDEVAFAGPNADLFSAEGGMEYARQWHPRTGSVERNFVGHTHAVQSVAASGDGGTLFTGSLDSTARQWDVKTGTCRTTFRGHKGRVSGVACPPGAAWLATASGDGEVRVWSPTTGEVTQSLMRHSVAANRLAVDPRGRRLAASFADGLIVVWDTSSWTEVLRLAHGRVFPTHYPYLPLAFSPDGKLLVSGGTNCKLRVWDLASGQAVWTKDRDDLAVPVLSIAFLPGGKQFVTGGGDWGTAGEVKVWNTLTGENTFTLRGVTREVYGVAVNPIDGSVAACSHEGAIKVFGLPTPLVAGRASRHQGDR